MANAITTKNAYLVKRFFKKYTCMSKATCNKSIAGDLLALHLDVKVHLKTLKEQHETASGFLIPLLGKKKEWGEIGRQLCF